jgi:hypothetical protein
MASQPLQSVAQYSNYVSKVIDRATVIRSTLAVWSSSPYTGISEGEIFFVQGFRLRLHEEIDFASSLITSYGYEIYHGEERLYWYDDFPHPNDKNLAETYPHHKHTPPNIKRNRKPAPGISFESPNLSFVIDEVEELIKQRTT